MPRDSLETRVEKLEDNYLRILKLFQNAQKFADDHPDVALTEVGKADEAARQDLHQR